VLATLAVPAAGGTLGIRVPAGFRVETFARGLSQPTAMAYGARALGSRSQNDMQA